MEVATPRTAPDGSFEFKDIPEGDPPIRYCDAATVVPVVVGQPTFRLPIAIFDLVALSGLGITLGILTHKLWELEEKRGGDGL